VVAFGTREQKLKIPNQGIKTLTVALVVLRRGASQTQVVVANYIALLMNNTNIE